MPDDDNNIPKIEGAGPVVRQGTMNDTLQTLIHLIRLEKSISLSKKKKDETDKFNKSQNEVQFLNNLRRILTIGGKEDGSFEITDGSELDKVIKSANASNSNTNNDNLKTLLENCGITSDKKNFTKQEKENAIDAIRMIVDQKHSINEMSIQTLTRLESEMDQTYQYLMTSVKTLNDATRTIARGIKGG